jgi:hypothetical protein
MEGQVRFEEDFESGLGAWDVYGTDGAFTIEPGDREHARVLVLRPNGDVHILVRGSEQWGGIRLEGEMLFPTDEDNYLGVVYNFQRRGSRMDFGNIYVKGNGSYLQVNPHRDYNVGRTLYSEYHVDLSGDDAVRIGEWTRFMAEVIGRECHMYVGDMSTPKLTFPFLELDFGSVGLQPRSVGGDVWVDNVRVSSIVEFTYNGLPIPDSEYDPGAMLTDWQVLGPLPQTLDDAARHPDAGHPWRPFNTDARGAVVTGRIVDSHGPRSIAYFRTRVRMNRVEEVTLHLSTIDDLAIWVNGRFHWFVDRESRAWYDFWTNPDHEGQRIPMRLEPGQNEIVVRVRGGVYATGGFFARLEDLETDVR